MRLLTGFVNVRAKCSFAVHMFWRETEEHSSANTTGITSKFKHTVKYPDLPSEMRPAPHSEELFVPKFPLIFSVDNSDSDEVNNTKKGIMLTPIRHLKQVVPNLNHVYENKEILTT
jgi:hypothetical protein